MNCVSESGQCIYIYMKKPSPISNISILKEYYIYRVLLVNIKGEYPWYLYIYISIKKKHIRCRVTFFRRFRGGFGGSGTFCLGGSAGNGRLFSLGGAAGNGRLFLAGGAGTVCRGSGCFAFGGT